jgi:excisionase family DNA binding protein
MNSAKPAFETIQFPERRSRPAQQTNKEVRSDPDLLKPHEVANRLGVSERWVRDHATRRSPRIPAVKLGALLRFRAADIEKFLDENRVSITSKDQSGGV